MQRRLRERDRTKERAVIAEQNRLRRLVCEYDEAQRRELEEEKWHPAQSLEEKASINLTRLLDEFFRSEQSQIEAIMIRTNERSKVHAYCQNAGFCSESFGKDPDRWPVVGRERRIVYGKIHELAGEARRTADEEKIAAAQRVRQQHAEVLQRADRKSWDISGKWIISCDEIHDYGDYPVTDVKMIIRIEEEDDHDDPMDHVKSGKKRKRSIQSKQIWATFDFGVLRGIMRFLDPKASIGEPYRESDFVFKAHGTPLKPATNTLNYRWRGRETGENVIQVHSDWIAPNIEFSEHGTMLKGEFQGPLLNKAKFTGLKIGPVPLMPSSLRPKVHDQWEKYSEGVYEQERISRWR